MCSDLFIGVFSADTLDVQKCSERSDFIAICNLSKQSEIGTHFVVLVGSDSQLIYLDTFALPCTVSPSLYNSLKQIRNRKITTLIKKPIQSSLSEYCGFFCIFFTCMFDFKRFPQISHMMSFSKSNLYKNDYICIENIKRLIKQN